MAYLPFVLVSAGPCLLRPAVCWRGLGVGLLGSGLGFGSREAIIGHTRDSCTRCLRTWLPGNWRGGETSRASCSSRTSTPENACARSCGNNWPSGFGPAALLMLCSWCPFAVGWKKRRAAGRREGRRPPPAGLTKLHVFLIARRQPQAVNERLRFVTPVADMSEVLYVRKFWHHLSKGVCDGSAILPWNFAVAV